MRRVERHIVVSNLAIEDIAHKAKNLYNYANYQIRQEFIKNSKLLNEYELTTLFAKENQVDYRGLPAQTAQQTIKLLFKNWKSFFAAIKKWKKNPKSFTGRPKLPGYKKKDGFSIVIFTSQQIKVKNGYIHFPKKVKLLPLKTNVIPKQVRIIPQSTCFVIEVVYEKEAQKTKVKPGSFLSIDLGVNNLATSINNAGAEPFIVNGKPLKSTNQYFNKQKAKLQSRLKGDQKVSKRINKITFNRNQKIHDYMHKTSRFIVNYAIKHKIETIIIGKNEQWKTSINIGKKNNQSFVQIPHAKLIDMIIYKAEEHSIKTIITEESYTSKTDNIVLEPLKKHGCDKISKPSLGKRIKRGLFRSSNGRAFSADINGAIGIARKVIHESVIKTIVDKSSVLLPRQCYAF